MSDKKHCTVEWPQPISTDWETQCEASPGLKESVLHYCQSNQLGNDFMQHIPTVYYPMACWLVNQSKCGMPYFVGVNGAQGSGKSTLTGFLTLLIEEGLGKRVLNLSIDDLYLSQADRLQVAKENHPLFATRGVPGTHDVELGLDLFEKLRRGQAGEQLSIPRYDKAQDDRLPESSWNNIKLPIDIVLFEGWCVGAIPQQASDLIDPVNQLESCEDTDGIWRTRVNDVLSNEYQDWFGQLDTLIMMKVPSMEQVYEWRGLQENKLKDATDNGQQQAIMDEKSLARFIMHYERLTRHQLLEMPDRADVLLTIDVNHQISNIKVKEMQ